MEWNSRGFLGNCRMGNYFFLGRPGDTRIFGASDQVYGVLVLVEVLLS